MAISNEIEFKDIGELNLDQQNPRLGRDKRKAKLDQPDLLSEMANWTLDELVDSFQQAGMFWVQEALIVVDSPGEQKGLVVIEGNRRLAALQLLEKGVKGGEDVPRWVKERIDENSPKLESDLFRNVPIIMADDRTDVTAYLGFRHVSGIKEWRPVEKAEFISELIDKDGLTFREAARKIGSRSDSVRQYYYAFKMLLQMEETEGFDWSEVEDRFSLLQLSLRSEGTRDFIGVSLTGDRPKSARPIPEEKEENSKDFSVWLFGTRKKKPIVRDSRNVDKLGEILGEPKAVEYLRSMDEPDFETAYSFATTTDRVIEPLEEAGRRIRLVLSELEERKPDDRVYEAARPVVDSSADLAIVLNGEILDGLREKIVAA